MDQAKNASEQRQHPPAADTAVGGTLLATLYKDAQAALTVALVALPVSMAIAISSGVPPSYGLYASAIGSCVVGLLSGSPFLISGPAGIFIMLTITTSARFGAGGLAAAIMLAGLLLMLLALLRLGALVRHIPHAVITGLTAGIALNTLVAQLGGILGVKLHAVPPHMLTSTLASLWTVRHHVSLAALFVSCETVAAYLLVRRLRPGWPAMIIAVLVVALTVLATHLPVDTIGSRFGGSAMTLRPPHLQAPTLAAFWPLLSAAVSFAVLAGTESLITAKIAEEMTGKPHAPGRILFALGTANLLSAALAGLCVMTTVARTVLNIRAGAQSRLAAILQSLLLLAFLLAAAPLVRPIPLACLASLVAIVCCSLIRLDEFARLLRYRQEGIILLASFLPTVWDGSTTGITVGCLAALACNFVERVKHQSLSSSELS
jgi:sulfate permease, SulP family